MKAERGEERSAEEEEDWIGPDRTGLDWSTGAGLGLGLAAGGHGGAEEEQQHQQ